MDENEKIEENIVDNSALEDSTSSRSDAENTQTAENSEELEESNVSEIEEDNGFKIITGDGSEIEISPVGEHLNAMKPKTQEEKSKKRIVIPEVKNFNTQEDNNNE